MRTFPKVEKFVGKVEKLISLKSTHALTRTKEGFVVGARLHGCTERAFYKVFAFLILHMIAMLFSLGLKEPGQCISSDFRFNQRGLRILILLSAKKEIMITVLL